MMNFRAGNLEKEKKEINARWGPRKPGRPHHLVPRISDAVADGCGLVKLHRDFVRCKISQYPTGVRVILTRLTQFGMSHSRPKTIVISDEGFLSCNPEAGAGRNRFRWWSSSNKVTTWIVSRTFSKVLWGLAVWSSGYIIAESRGAHPKKFGKYQSDTNFSTGSHRRRQKDTRVLETFSLKAFMSYTRKMNVGWPESYFTTDPWISQEMVSMGSPRRATSC